METTTRTYNPRDLSQHVGNTYLAKDSLIRLSPKGKLRTTPMGSMPMLQISDFRGYVPELVAGIPSEDSEKADRAIMGYDKKTFEKIITTKGRQPEVGDHLAIMLNSVDAEIVGEFGYLTKPLEAIE